MNIAAYCRVSTEKEDQLNSMEAQKRFFGEYSQKHGYRLVCLYADEGISGTKIKNRTEFQRLMHDAESGIFDMVVVKDISRFARNTVDLLQSTRKLKSLGIETTFLTANMSVLGNSEFVLTIFGALAQEESANTSKRVKFGKRLNAEKGRVPNLVYGYDKQDCFQMSVNQSEAAVIEQIFEWYIDDGYGTQKIAQMLNARGVRTKRLCQWTQNAVCRILTNELYTGKIINGKQEVTDFLTSTRADRASADWLVAERPELRIITPERYRRAGEIMKLRGKSFQSQGKRQSNKYLFSTLIQCRECGWSYRRMVRTYQNTYTRWVCSRHNGKGAHCCHNAVGVDEQDLLKAFQDYCCEILNSCPNILRQVEEEWSKAYRQKHENMDRLRGLREKRQRLQRLRTKYMNMYTDDIMTREELQEKLCGVRAEAERIEKELDIEKIGSRESLQALISRRFSKVEDICDFSVITNSQLRLIIERIEVDSKGSVDIFLHDFMAPGRSVS